MLAGGNRGKGRRIHGEEAHRGHGVEARRPAEGEGTSRGEAAGAARLTGGVTRDVGRSWVPPRDLHRRL